MTLTLHGRHIRALGEVSSTPFVGRITEHPGDADLRSREIVLVRTGQPTPAHDRLSDYRAMFFEDVADAGSTACLRDCYALGRKMRYLAHGDVVRVDPRRSHVSALYRRSSPSNSFLVTERCDNYCVMCSQPPKPQDDSWLVDEWKQVIPLISPETREIGITGGEPALLGERLVEVVAMMAKHLPRTAVHILSNGRRFSDAALARSISLVRHPDLMIGIPLYSDLSEEHDYVVQAKGAFSETVRGILNLKQHRTKVEVRVVLHRETYARLPELARFLVRNLLFVDHVALMGLEMMGFAKTNADWLWIDPLDYRRELAEAVEILDRAGLYVSIYNHQLCVLPPTLHPFARKSISDWKNAYADECANCERREDCGGFFSSGISRRSRGITPMSISDATLRHTPQG